MFVNLLKELTERDRKSNSSITSNNRKLMVKILALQNLACKTMVGGKKTKQ